MLPKIRPASGRSCSALPPHAAPPRGPTSLLRAGTSWPRATLRSPWISRSSRCTREMLSTTPRSRRPPARLLLPFAPCRPAAWLRLQRFSAVIMRIREPKTTALIFKSGKMVVTGAKSEEQARARCVGPPGIPAAARARFAVAAGAQRGAQVRPHHPKAGLPRALHGLQDSKYGWLVRRQVPRALGRARVQALSLLVGARMPAPRTARAARRTGPNARTERRPVRGSTSPSCSPASSTAWCSPRSCCSSSCRARWC